MTDDLDALLLAGGLGTRLRPVVADRPKPLAEVDGQPFLSILLEYLSRFRVRSATLCVHHMATHFENLDLGSELKVFLNREPRRLGTAGALTHALKQSRAMGRALSDPLLVMNADSICDVDVDRFLEWFLTHDFSAGLALVPEEDIRHYGSINFSPNGQVEAFMEKASCPGPGWVNAGVYLIRQRVLNALPVNQVLSLEHQVFPALINDGGGGVGAWPHCSQLIDIGTPERYLRARFAIAKILCGAARKTVKDR